MPPRSAGLAEITGRAGEQDLTVITVALDSRGEVAVREFIEAAQPTYPCLIDREHRVATLYGMHNVPSAVWIDEAGRIVRTAEPLGTLDTIRQMDPKTREIPEALKIERARRRDHYYQAIRDWADRGAASIYALSSDAVRQRLPAPVADHALATAHFRLGEYLHELGRDEEAQLALETAATLHPESWTIGGRAGTWQAPGAATGRPCCKCSTRWAIPRSMSRRGCPDWTNTG